MLIAECWEESVNNTKEMFWLGKEEGEQEKNNTLF